MLNLIVFISTIVLIIIKLVGLDVTLIQVFYPILSLILWRLFTGFIDLMFYIGERNRRLNKK